MTCSNLLDIVVSLPLRRLSISLNFLFAQQQPDFRRHPFSSLTHLELLDEGASLSLVQELSLLPSLTHLAYGYCPTLEVIQGSLEHCKKLQALVLFQQPGLVRGGPTLVDMRLVIDRRSMDLWEEDWHAGIENGNDFWNRADAIVSLRRDYSEHRFFPTMSG